MTPPKPTAADFERALADCLRAEIDLDQVDDQSPDEEQTRAARADREARERMIQLLRRLQPGPSRAVAVSLRGGTVISWTPEGDGLAIVLPGDFRNFGSLLD